MTDKVLWLNKSVLAPFALLVLLAACPPASAADPNAIQLKAKNTITALELDPGETTKFTLANGQTRSLTLESTAARILEHIDNVGTVYEFTADVSVDGHPMTMRRYVGSQESFYEPYVINGLRIWFDGVQNIFDFLTENHGDCRPGKRARFALQDAGMSICPQKLHPWCTMLGPGRDSEPNFIDIRNCYNGDDPWLGAFKGIEAHGGLDINHDKGTFLYCPIDFNDHWFFNSVRNGDNNNRWRAIRQWPNGDIWTLQSHHLICLTVPEHGPLEAGTQYARTAGVYIGAHPHTHFVFKTQAPGQPEILLDPWFIFWQTFEQQRQKANRVRSRIQPLSPVHTGQKIVFDLSGPQSGQKNRDLGIFWTFGDGASTCEPNPEHAYAKPGIYPVTLTADDGIGCAAFTQHVTVDGPPIDGAALALDAPGEVSFLPRPVDQMDIYGRPSDVRPYTLHFYATPARPKPNTKVVRIRNVGQGTLPQIPQPGTKNKTTPGWLTITRHGEGNSQYISLVPDASKFEPGSYRAIISVVCPDALNRELQFTVILHVMDAPPSGPVIVDDADPGFSCTPYFWVGHRFFKCKDKGYNDFYLTNGGRPDLNQFARFTPLLAAGSYEVSFSDKTPFRTDTEFDVLVHSADGDKTVSVKPADSRTIGTFRFNEGGDGFIQLQAENSSGLVIADAVNFEPAN